jgi:AraC family transcriptional regulator of adaptative response / DNA-3-methyladenine glycosylase II
MGRGFMNGMELDFDSCYRAIESRDARFDGRFFTGVLTTGIYCRPICPARTPLRRNVTFFKQAAAAEAAGFRPCKRCRPDTTPDARDWNVRSDIVRRAMTLIDQGALDEGDVAALAARLHVGDRHLRRLFALETGTSPNEIARHRRLRRARHLIESNVMPISEVAYSAGYSSLRQFNDSIRTAFGTTPSALRAQPRRGKLVPARLTVRLSLPEPYDAEPAERFLASHVTPGLESFDEGTFRRAFGSGARRAIVSVAPVEESHLTIGFEPLEGDVLAEVIAGVRRLYDLDSSPTVIASSLRRDPLLRALVKRRPGMRVPGAIEPFEAAVRVVIGQQVSVTGANTISGRIVARWGEPTGTEPSFHFPAPEVLAEAPVEEAGMPGQRGRAVRALAAAVASGDIPLTGPADPAEVREKLLALPGIGPWSAAYIAMRALGDPDAFPLGDLGLVKAFERRGGGTKTDLERRAERWRPWGSYAAMHLWASLADESEKETA